MVWTCPWQASRSELARIRALIVLLAAERRMVAAEIAAVVRLHEETVRRWLVRYQAEGRNGLADAPRIGAPAQVTHAYRQRLLAVVRRRPRALGLTVSLWTEDRLSDYLAEQTSIRMSKASVYRLLRVGGIHLNRPQHTIMSPDPEYALKQRRWSAPAAR